MDFLAASPAEFLVKRFSRCPNEAFICVHLCSSVVKKILNPDRLHLWPEKITGQHEEGVHLAGALPK